MSPSRLLRVNAAFLMFMGGAAAVADAAGHFLGKGPFGKLMFQAPLTISSFEAHLLALILGAVLYKGASLPGRRSLHTLAAVIHLVLGGSNLLFFDTAFGALDQRGFGAAITALHIAFAVAQGVAAVRRPSAALATAAS